MKQSTTSVNFRKRWAQGAACLLKSLAVCVISLGAISSVHAQEKDTPRQIESLADVYDLPNQGVANGQSRIIFYNPSTSSLPGVATVYINGRYHASLSAGAYSPVCLPPGKVELGTRQIEIQKRANKDGLDSMTLLSLQNGQNQYVRVQGDSRKNIVLMPVTAIEAQKELTQTRLQIHTISRVSEAVECVNATSQSPAASAAALKTAAPSLRQMQLSGDTLFAFDRADAAGLTQQGLRAIDQLTAQIKAEFSRIDKVTSWSYQVSSASATTHNYVAKVVNSSSAVVGMSNTFVLKVKTSPLVLDLNGDGVQTTGLTQGAAFDMDANGSAEHVGWVSPQDGLLVRDLNGNGQVDNGTELLGSHTVLPDGTKAQDGWAALAALDSNGDGKVDAQDAAFGELRVWQDANGNGVADAGELKSLSDLGIASVNTGHDNRSVEQNGNTLQGFGSFTTTDGTAHQVADAWLQSTTDSYAVNDSGKLTLLDNHMQLDLSKVTGTQALTEVDMSADAAANSVKLNLADLLAQPANSQGLHQLLLTGNANDSAQVNLPDWTDTGTTVTQAGHTYEVFHATTDAHAQLLIDQAMLMNVH